MVVSFFRLHLCVLLLFFRCGRLVAAWRVKIASWGVERRIVKVSPPTRAGRLLDVGEAHAWLRSLCWLHMRRRGRPAEGAIVFVVLNTLIRDANSRAV